MNVLNAATILTGDCLTVLPTLAVGSVHCCITSPPYWGLRDYGHDDQIGLEKSPEEYIARMVAVFREVWRVLRDDGTLWLNLGDTYASAWACNRRNVVGNGSPGDECIRSNRMDGNLKEKDLVGIPWRVALALQADGWWLRSDIIWHKPNQMPESAADRCTRAHEYVFMLTKAKHYYYDAVAIQDAAIHAGEVVRGVPQKAAGMGVVGTGNAVPGATFVQANGRNKRSVWTVPTSPYAEAHFATFPPKLIEPMVLAGTSSKGCCAACGKPYNRIVEKERYATRPGTNSKVTGNSATEGNRDKERHETASRTIGWEAGCDCNAGKPVPCTVLDPFLGSGTTLDVACRKNRHGVGIELNPEYIELARQRITKSIVNKGFGL